MAKLTLQEYEQCFWSRFGPYLHGTPRKPQSATEWLDPGRLLCGVQTLDERAKRLKKAATATPPAQPEQRRNTTQDGDVFYNNQGEACCSIHDKPLQEGKWDYCCSAKDHRGKNGYCDFRTKGI